jgi:hypothetical protein
LCERERKRNAEWELRRRRRSHSKSHPLRSIRALIHPLLRDLLPRATAGPLPMVTAASCDAANRGWHEDLSNVISLSSYDIFEMPVKMQKKPPREWSRAEASDHFEWFMAIKDERIRQILLASEAADSSLETRLGKITETIRRSLDQLASVSGDVQSVNGLGFIVGFDAALVLGDALTHDVVGARWTIMKTKIRTFHSRNFPVVRRESTWAFEPWFEGRLLLSLINREAGKEHTNVLYSVYNIWCERLKNGQTPKSR